MLINQLAICPQCLLKKSSSGFNLKVTFEGSWFQTSAGCLLVSVSLKKETCSFMEIQTRKLVWMCCLEEAPLVVTQAVDGANVTERTQSLEQLRRLCISVSISRTRCAASNDITRQEIRTFEVHQTIYSSVTSLSFCVANLPGSCLLEGPVTLTWNRCCAIFFHLTRNGHYIDAHAFCPWLRFNIILRIWLLLPKMATQV